MKVGVDRVVVHVATGGRAHVAGRPWIVLLHGAGHSHLIWVLQSRALAHDGWNVAAPDLPGHFLSGGEPLASVAEQAAFVARLMDELGAPRAVVAGHSMGGLVALELSRAAPERVSGLVLVATAAAIPVNARLIATARSDEELAFASMTSWGFGPDAHLNENTWPGGGHIGFSLDAMRLNRPGALAVDLEACNAYAAGMEAARGVAVPALGVFAEADRMTPVRNGLALGQAIPGCRTVVLAGSGHTVPTERPRELTAEMRSFAAALASPA